MRRVIHSDSMENFQLSLSLCTNLVAHSRLLELHDLAVQQALFSTYLLSLQVSLDLLTLLPPESLLFSSHELSRNRSLHELALRAPSTLSIVTSTCTLIQ
jgi:hypothetical protein